MLTVRCRLVPRITHSRSHPSTCSRFHFHVCIEKVSKQCARNGGYARLESVSLRSSHSQPAAGRWNKIIAMQPTHSATANSLSLSKYLRIDFLTLTVTLGLIHNILKIGRLRRPCGPRGPTAASDCHLTSSSFDVVHPSDPARCLAAQPPTAGPPPPPPTFYRRSWAPRP
jgi:hypothetical protein